MARCDLPGNRLLYGLTLASGILECLCFSGVVFGYASLVFVLKEDGYFGHLCVSVPLTGDNLSAAVQVDCSRQDEQFSLVFTIASFLHNFVNLFNGYMFDRFGTMVTRLLAISVYTTGTLVLAFSSAAFSELLFPALSCIAVGGIVLLMTNMQMGNLFAAHRSTIITLCTGAYDSSASVFLVFKVLHQQGISLRSCLLVLSSCSVFHLVRTFLLMPRTLIPYPLPPHYTYGLSCGEANGYHAEKFEGPRKRAAVVLHESGEKDDVPPAAEGETEAQGPGKAASFRSCLLSWFFLWHLVWLSIMQLRHYLFIGTLNPMLLRLAHGDPDLVSQYTNAFALTQLFGVLCGPLNGLIMDRHKGRPLAPGETAQEADLHSSSLSLLLTSLQCLLFSVCASIPLLPLQYLTFALQVLNRSFIYGGNAAFINIAFPACHFGKLYGAVMSLSAVFSLLQYPCFTLVKGPLGGDPFFVDIALIGINLLGFIHPAYVFMHCRAAARRRENGDVTKL